MGTLQRIRAGGADTNGEFAVIECVSERGHGSPLHLHRNAAETFLVLDGTLRVKVGEDDLSAGAGSCAVLPRGIQHAFVVTSASARYLTIHTPAGFDTFIGEAGEEFHGQPRPTPRSRQELQAIAGRHGIEILGPPLQVEST